MAKLLLDSLGFGGTTVAIVLITMAFMKWLFPILKNWFLGKEFKHFNQEVNGEHIKETDRRLDELDAKFDKVCDKLDKVCVAIDKQSEKLGDLSVQLEKNNKITDACAKAVRRSLLEKMRFFVQGTPKTADNDNYFQSMYKEFLEAGNGDEGHSLKKAWDNKEWEKGDNDLRAVAFR